MACLFRCPLSLILRLLFLALWQDLQELQIKDERLTWRDGAIRAARGPITQTGRNNQFPVVALAHDLKGFHPTSYERLGYELVGKTVLRAVEHRAVNQFPRVVDIDAIVRPRMLARSVLQDSILKTARPHDYPTLL